MATRMQQRKGTAAQWISTNSGQGPVLNAGEIGFEMDTNKFKIGDGVNHWVDLNYFIDGEGALAEVTALIDGAPAALNTLNELAAAINDDPTFFTTIATNLSNHQSDTTNIHGIADTSLLATTANVATAKSEAISAASSDATTKANAAQTAAESTAASALSSAISTEVSNRNTAISTAVDNLVDGAPALLNTLNELAAAISDDANYTTTITTALGTKAPLASPELTGVPTAPTAAADTNTTQIATTAFAKAEADAAQQAAAADATAKATSVQAAAEATAAAALSAHDSDTTNIHGIANTSLLETQSGAQTKVDTHSSDTTSVHGIADTSLLETQTGAQTKADSAVSSHSSDTTNIHGIADTQALETQTGAQGKVDSHNSATTNVHGIEDTADLATQQYVLDQIANSTEDYPDLAGEGLDWNGVTLAFDIDSTVATKTYADTAVSTHSSDTTSVHGITDTAELATKAFAAELLTNATKTNVTITGDKNGLTITAENGVADSTTSDLAEGTNLYFTNERAQDAIGNSLGTGLTYTDSTGAISVTTNTYDSYGSASAVAGDLSTHISDTTDVHGIANTANLATKQYAASLLLNATKTNITITGDVDGLTINAENGVADSDTDFLTEGTNNLYFTTERAQDAVGNSVGTGLSYNDATGAVSVDSTLVQSRVADVSDTEIGYLNGVTSSIQTQIDTKAALVSPTFTGTVSGITKSMVGLANVDNTTDAAKPVSTAQATAIATAKSEAIADATSQVNAVIAAAPAALNTLDELAAALGDDANFAGTITATLATKAPLDAPTFTGTVSGITKSMVGLGNVDNTSDSSKPVSSATQTALDAKLASATAATTYAPLNAPTFTGTVSGVTKAHVGLGNVDNTSDANKPVSTATQTALDLKANTSAVAELAQDAVNTAIVAGTGLDKAYDDIANTITLDIDSTVATLTGTQTLTNKTLTSPAITTPTGITKSDVGLANVDNTTDAGKPVSTATQTALDLKAPLANPTFTGTVTLPTGTVTSGMILDGAIVNADINASAAIAQSKISGLTSDLAAKLALVGGTMTGALTLSADPSASLHAATKQYVDNTASGVIAKPQVLGATTANINATYSNGTAGVGATLTHNTNGVFPAESGGASGWAVGKGILVKNQTNKAQNGRYYVSNMGSVSTPYVLTRCGYCDEASEIPGAYIFVQDGTSAGTGWIQVVADPATFVVGTDNIDVFQFSGSGTITAGTGITVSGNEVSISTGAITSSLILDGTIVDGDINASAAIAQSKISGLTSDLAAKAPLASPTFTGTVAGITKSMVGLGNVDNTTDAGKPVSTATQTALDLKANLASPTLTGTPISTTAAADTNTTQIATTAYVVGQASSATPVVNGTAAVGTSLKYARADHVHGTDTSRAPLANPTFTGTVAGITKSMVGLANVDNTADSAKPVSTAQQTALDLKANLAGPTFTGTVTLPSGTVTSAMILDGTIVNGDISATAAIAQSKIDGLSTSLGLKANLASPALTGTPTAPTAAAGTNTTQVATTAFVGTAVADLVASAPSALNTLNELATALGNDAAFSTTVTNAIAAKSNTASPTFTGTVTIPTLTLTNPLTAANGGTGLSSLGTGVATFLGTPSSANLAAMITDEIGTGNIVLSEIATSSQTASYTLVAGDRGKLVEMNVGSANTLTVPLDSTINFPVGTQIDILQVGSGQTTVAGAVGVTVNATPGLKIRAQWGGATLIKRAANTWVLIGDLTA
jgi:hypothetical protein